MYASKETITTVNRMIKMMYPIPSAEFEVDPPLPLLRTSPSIAAAGTVLVASLPLPLLDWGSDADGSLTAPRTVPYVVVVGKDRVGFRMVVNNFPTVGVLDTAGLMVGWGVVLNRVVVVVVVVASTVDVVEVVVVVDVVVVDVVFVVAAVDAASTPGLGQHFALGVPPAPAKHAPSTNGTPLHTCVLWSKHWPL